MGETLLGSASQLHRTMPCPASQWLPQSDTKLGDQGAQLTGTEIHKLLELSPEKQHAGSVVGPGHREVKFVHNSVTRTARVVTEGDTRYYGDNLDSHDTPGTADVVVPGFSVLEIVDYKSGVSGRRLEARGNRQLLHLALCAWRAGLANRAGWFALTIQSTPSVEDCAPCRTVLVDRWALEEHEAELVQAQERSATAKYQVDSGLVPRVVEGPHCWLCPARAACPAKQTVR